MLRGANTTIYSYKDSHSTTPFRAVWQILFICYSRGAIAERFTDKKKIKKKCLRCYFKSCLPTNGF